MKKAIKQPIFVIGVGRSGSSIFHRMFCDHPHVAWLSHLCNQYVDKPHINGWMMKQLDYPIIGPYLKSKLNPAESYRFWEHYCKGFSRPFRDLYAEDVTHKTRQSIQQAMSHMLTAKRDRLLIKITGWPRVRFLREIFNDAKFIHIVRDGRAVANSMLTVDWWCGWQGPQNWRWGELTAAQQAIFEQHNRSFVALAAIEWNLLMDNMMQAQACVSPNDFFEIRYEDFCLEPVGTFKQIIEYAELAWSADFENAIKTHKLQNTNDKWQKELTPHQHRILNDIMHDYLIRYNYL
jgi:hypothetical protein